MPATERINIRTTPTAKSVIEQASNITGVSMSSFIVTTAYEKALQLVNEQQASRIVLTPSEWQNAIQLLDNPPQANDKLTELFTGGYRAINQ